MNRWNKRNDQDGSLSDVNMTPLIDVSLVLVVILLLATPLAFEASIGIGRADVQAKPAQEEAANNRIELDIVADTRIEVDGRAVGLRDLAGALRPLLAGKNRLVSVACADRVSHGVFVRVLDIARINGAAAIAVAGR